MHLFYGIKFGNSDSDVRGWKSGSENRKMLLRKVARWIFPISRDENGGASTKTHAQKIYAKNTI